MGECCYTDGPIPAKLKGSPTILATFPSNLQQNKCCHIPSITAEIPQHSENTDTHAPRLGSESLRTLRKTFCSIPRKHHQTGRKRAQ